jgi:hypothetical protein
MKTLFEVSIEVKTVGDYYKAEIKSGSVEVSMPRCYTPRDSLTDALKYVAREIERREYSKFGLIQHTEAMPK